MNKEKPPFWKSPNFWGDVLLGIALVLLTGAAEGAKSYFQKREKEKHLK